MAKKTGEASTSGKRGGEMVAPKEREDQAYVADSASAVASTCSALAATSSLLMAIEDAQSDFLLQGSEGDLSNPDLWYLDTGATNHMTGRSINLQDSSP
ncbi:unnamed protein product [Spirodela intermedia]|uniref:Uncharacterized protein n=1 Tax=Spirodela intermedia TaxID=51605 RepID=A0A7I8KZG8_SPIIN|nr:unnamed protein product [Spirodela intermedia]